MRTVRYTAVRSEKYRDLYASELCSTYSSEGSPKTKRHCKAVPFLLLKIYLENLNPARSHDLAKRARQLLWCCASLRCPQGFRFPSGLFHNSNPVHPFSTNSKNSSGGERANFREAKFPCHKCLTYSGKGSPLGAESNALQKAKGSAPLYDLLYCAGVIAYRFLKHRMKYVGVTPQISLILPIE